MHCFINNYHTTNVIQILEIIRVKCIIGMTGIDQPTNISSILLCECVSLQIYTVMCASNDCNKMGITSEKKVDNKSKRATAIEIDNDDDSNDSSK